MTPHPELIRIAKLLVAHAEAAHAAWHYGDYAGHAEACAGLRQDLEAIGQELAAVKREAIHVQAADAVHRMEAARE